jgi:hypothetical protein
MAERLLQRLESADPHLGRREGVHPSDQTDALGRGGRLKAKLADCFRRSENRLEHDADGNLAGTIQRFRNRLGVLGHLAQRFFAVEMLASRNEPDFVLLQIDHSACSPKGRLTRAIRLQSKLPRAGVARQASNAQKSVRIAQAQRS